jgi:putative FmdB family regulatory protein
MPIYEYRCKNDHLFEVMQRMSDDPLETCTVCGAPVQRVFHPVAVHFKGSGFYNTDYGKKKKGGSDGAAPDGEASKSDSSSKDSSSQESSKSSSSSRDSKTAASGD